MIRSEPMVSMRYFWLSVAVFSLFLIEFPHLAAAAELPTLTLRFDIYNFSLPLAKNPQMLRTIETVRYEGFPFELAELDATVVGVERKKKVVLDAAAIEKWLSERVAPRVERAAESVVISELSDGSIDFQGTGMSGVRINKPKTIAAMERALAEKVRFVQISIDETPAPVSVLSPRLRAAGIREVVATGTSDYSGSTSNRLINVRLGAKKLDGHFVAAGSGFSVVSKIGEVDGKNGWVKELIIRQGKTVPDYGGGLCQVSSTLFRAALLAGLPIDDRSAHSYAVDYYEPFGTDATIYPGSHDLQFRNDTPSAILIHSFFEPKKSQLHFTLFGTRDGRSVSISSPVYSRFISPPPPKIVESSSLALGEKLLVSRAHGGFDALFHRFVRSASGSMSVDAFGSRYQPVQKVTAIGVQVE